MLPKLADTQNVGPVHALRVCEHVWKLQVLAGQSFSVHGQLAAGNGPTRHLRSTYQEMMMAPL